MRDTGSLFSAGIRRGLFIGCISTLVAIPIIGGCLVLLPTVIFPGLDQLAAGGNGNTAMLVVLALVLVAMVGLIALPLAVVLVLTLRRAHYLDSIFLPLGLTGSFYMLIGRHYQGQLAGREADVYIYRGPSVEIRLKAASQTRLIVTPQGSLPASLAQLFDRQPVETGNPVLKAYSIFPSDKAWAGALLAEARTAASIQTLMTRGANWAILRRVEIQPGEVGLYLNRSHSIFGNSINLDSARAWLKALESLAQAVEDQPAPAIPERLVGEPARPARQKKSTFLVYAVIALIFIMPLCFVAIGGIAYLVVSMIG